MLIRVNETTWIHAADVKRIYITHATFHGKPRFDVNVETDDDEYSSFWDDKSAAIAEANRMADIINLVEENNHENFCTLASQKHFRTPRRQN